MDESEETTASMSEIEGRAVASPVTLLDRLGSNASVRSPAALARFILVGGVPRSRRRIQFRLARSLDLPMPKVGVIPYANAFAMGTSTSDAVVAIGRPFLDKLPMSQVEAIIGHELGHVVSGDMRRMMLMRTFQNATVFYAVFAGFKHFMRHVICWAAEFYILAFSRRREFWADAIGAALTSKEAMIGALRSLESMPSVSRQERIHARFMFRGPWRAVYKTHPETSARIRALEEETYMRRLPFLRD